MIKSSFFRALMVAAGLLAAFVAATPANAEVEININKGNVEPLPIAITDFLQGELGKKISDVVEADLKRRACSSRSTRAPSSRRSATPTPRRALKTGRSSMPRRSSPVA